MNDQANNRIRAQEACFLLECAPSTLWKMKKEEVFTIDYPNGGAGRGKRCWYYRDEIILFKESRDKDKVRSFRRRMKRLRDTVKRV